MTAIPTRPTHHPQPPCAVAARCVSFRWLAVLAAVAAMMSGPTSQAQELETPQVSQSPPERDESQPIDEFTKETASDRPWPAAPLTESLVTDRPDFTESTETIPYGHFQLESGYTFTFDREGTDRLRDHTAPELLLRVGLIEKLELRLDWAGYSYQSIQYEGETRGGRRITREDNDQGANDFALGFKYKLFEQDGWVPHFGVIGAVSMPTGSALTTAGDAEPEVVLLWAYDITERFALAGNVGFFVPTDDDGRYFQTAASLSGAYAITDRLGSYVEYFGFYPNTRDADCAHTLNGGFTYLITDNFQVDIRAGFGLNEEADDFFTGVGFAWRW